MTITTLAKLSNFVMRFFAVALLVYLGVSMPFLTNAQAADPQKLTSSVVKIETRAISDSQSAETLGRSRSGSGVIIESQLVLTIGYLLLEADTVDVLTASGKRIPASVAGYDHSTGFGLVRTALPVDGTHIVLGDSDKVIEKQKVFTIGHGETEATELAVVSRKPFSGNWEYLIDKPFFTFPPVNNWSGAALLNEEGALIGIGSLIVNDAAAEKKGIPGNMFVPTNLLKPILADLLASGRRTGLVQPWLGMTTEIVRGVLLVQRVSSKGPADMAGIAKGDIVIGVGNKPVADQTDFYKKVWSTGSAGSEITLKVLQGGELKDVKVKSIDRMDFIKKPSGI
jgi:serine protease Do